MVDRIMKEVSLDTPSLNFTSKSVAYSINFTLIKHTLNCRFVKLTAMNIIGLSDRALIRKFLSGEESAFETLIMRYKDRVFSQLIIMLKDRELAEDLFQDTFIKVINTLKSGTYNEEGKFIHWVMRIAHNLVIDHFRKKKRIPIKENSSERYSYYFIS